MPLQKCINFSRPKFKFQNASGQCSALNELFSRFDLSDFKSKSLIVARICTFGWSALFVAIHQVHFSYIIALLGFAGQQAVGQDQNHPEQEAIPISIFIINKNGPTALFGDRTSVSKRRANRELQTPLKMADLRKENGKTGERKKLAGREYFTNLFQFVSFIDHHKVRHFYQSPPTQKHLKRWHLLLDTHCSSHNLNLQCEHCSNVVTTKQACPVFEQSGLHFGKSTNRALTERKQRFKRHSVGEEATT